MLLQYLIQVIRACLSDLAEAVLENKESFSAFAVKPDGTVTEFAVSTGMLTGPERKIIADGCLINYYRNSQE